MQTAGQPCIDLSWPVPDNLVPLSSLVNIHQGPAMGLITQWLVRFTDILTHILLVFFKQLYAHPGTRTCMSTGMHLYIYLSPVKERIHSKLSIKKLLDCLGNQSRIEK